MRMGNGDPKGDNLTWPNHRLHHQDRTHEPTADCHVAVNACENMLPRRQGSICGVQPLPYHKISSLCFFVASFVVFLDTTIFALETDLFHKMAK